MEDTSKQDAKTIVLVEDEDLVRRLVSRVLENEGYRVVDASSGEEGLEILEGDDQADLLLTDLTLPGEIDGLELGRRALDEHDDLKLVCMSGYREEDMDAELLRTAANAEFVGKPFTPSELVETVKRVLGEPGR
jgi:two-component system cell cycle sensor histidine kinase/response regulator CckA